MLRVGPCVCARVWVRGRAGAAMHWNGGCGLLLCVNALNAEAGRAARSRRNSAQRQKEFAFQVQL